MNCQLKFLSKVTPSQLPLIPCSQVIVLTHEDAGALELDPYHSMAFYPCRPKVMFGKAARRERETKDKRWLGKEVVGAGYNDMIIRFAALDCFPDEHRVIIAEQDHRFNEEDCSAFEYLSELKVDDVFDGQPIRQSIKPPGSFEEPSAHLRDVLACCTAAHRWTTPKCPGGHDNWIWPPHYQWTKGFQDKRKQILGTGNYLHTSKSSFARWILENVLAQTLTHVKGKMEVAEAEDEEMEGKMEMAKDAPRTVQDPQSPVHRGSAGSSLGNWGSGKDAPFVHCCIDYDVCLKEKDELRHLKDWPEERHPGLRAWGHPALNEEESSDNEDAASSWRESRTAGPQ